MKKPAPQTAIIFLISVILLLSLNSFATIINIPADYPTIQQGIDASADGDTVLVQPGTYVENINFNGHNIVLGSLFLTTGDTSYIAQTSIDGTNNGSVVEFANGEDSTAALYGFSVKHGLAFQGGGIFCQNADPRIINNIIEDNLADAGGGVFCFNSIALIRNNIIRGNNFISPSGNPGGGICCKENSSPVIMQNLIYDNVNQDGGGIAVVESSPLIMNNVIIRNRAFDLGGAIRSDYSTPVIINNTFAENSATTGGGIYLLTSPGTIITNSIFWNDSAGTSDEIHGAGASSTITFCDIDGGHPGEGNIDIDPLFKYAAEGNYHLMVSECGDSLDSPCIDTGDPDILDSLLGCSWGLGGLRSDIGAYGGGDSLITSIFHNIPKIPFNFMLLQNYPNPFNAQTTIRFALPNAQRVQLSIYDLLGRQIEVLIDEYMDAGVHDVTFDASPLPSGVYFYRLRPGDVVETKRMVLLK